MNNDGVAMVNQVRTTDLILLGDCDVTLPIGTIGTIVSTWEDGRLVVVFDEHPDEGYVISSRRLEEIPDKA